MVAPIRGALVEARLFSSSEINHSRTAAATRKRSRLAEIVNPRPDEIADDVIVVAHAEPVMNCVTGFRAEENSFRKSRAFGNVSVGRVEPVNVIVAADVEGIHEAVAG